eukprot:CAMPEP_0170555560 /NCGR_PEP_ID=MMETSP0211-20121228/13457_1 /TAXON_ID=311385 /ORGANISM="Pseudokeronopsis sp., Strain OXSARD2" /LENGTH=57 /DNA_ID=CAMNT_0010865481 /DNA_START=163 /DNA_END=336 /DNA_ORIENTATION=-
MGCGISEEIRKINKVEELVEEFESMKYKARGGDYGDYIKKNLDEYTLDNCQELVGGF